LRSRDFVDVCKHDQPSSLDINNHNNHNNGNNGATAPAPPQLDSDHDSNDSNDEIHDRGGRRSTVTTEKGPNDAGRVVWALGESFFIIFGVF
jgi:hypothetical protein